MLALLLAAQKVELVGGESWLEHDSVAIAAITAAAIAALVSILNRRAQLKHDRELRNRDYVRDAIDSSAGAINDAVIAVHEYVSHCENSAIAQDSPQVQAAREAARLALYKTRTAVVLLEIRLDQDHDVVETYEGVRKALQTLFNKAASADTSPESLDDLRSPVGDAFIAFRKACFTWLVEERN